MEALIILAGGSIALAGVWVGYYFGKKEIESKPQTSVGDKMYRNESGLLSFKRRIPDEK